MKNKSFGQSRMGVMRESQAKLKRAVVLKKERKKNEQLCS